jgi:phasin
MNDITQQMAHSPSEADIKTAFNAASLPVAAVQENVRKAVEKSVSDSRAAYTRARAAADEATGAVETCVTRASKGVVDFNSKAFEALQANASANFDFLKAWVNAKSIEEVFSLQTELARKHAAALSEQARELSALAQKIATDAAEPIKAHVAKTFRLPA